MQNVAKDIDIASQNYTLLGNEKIILQSAKAMSLITDENLSFEANSANTQIQSDYTIDTGNSLNFNIGETTITATSDNITLKAGGVEVVIDSNAVYANDIKLYDSNDKGAMSMSFAICDIECKEILGHNEMETSSTSKNTKSTINTASQGDTSHFIYQDSNIKVKEIIDNDTSSIVIEYLQGFLDYQGNTADTLMAGVSGIFASMAELAKQLDSTKKDNVRIFGAKGRIAYWIF